MCVLCKCAVTSFVLVGATRLTIACVAGLVGASIVHRSYPQFGVGWASLGLVIRSCVCSGAGGVRYCVAQFIRDVLVYCKMLLDCSTGGLLVQIPPPL